MKRTFTLAFILSFIYLQVNAQTFDWLRSAQIEYDWNPGMISYNTAANPQGGCYFYGVGEHISFYNESMGVLFLKKYDQDGAETWSRSISGESCVKGMVSDDNGDVYISGQILTDADFWGEGSLEKTGIGTDAFVARVSSEGDLEWCLNLTGLPMGEGTVSEMVLHEDMLFVAYSTWMNSYVLFFNEEGALVDSLVQEDVGVLSGLDIDQEGNLYTSGSCAGWQASFGGVPYPAPFSYSTYLVKYNSSFEPAWVKYVEDVTCPIIQVKVDDEGGVYFAGQLMAGTLFDTIAVNGAAWVYDFFLARLDPEGHYQWVIECPEVLTGDASTDNQHFLTIDEDGNALMSGLIRGVIDWGNGVITDVTEDYQHLIIWNYGPDGVINWAKTAGGPAYDQAQSISAGSDGEAYIAGLISGEGSFDSITYETETYIEPFITRLDLGILSGLPHQTVKNDLLVYPNPAKDRVFVYNVEGMESYRILNTQGLLIQSGTLSGLKPEISVNDIAPGLYLVELSGKTRSKIISKLIIQS